MKTIDFIGGLGDAIRQCYRHNSYTQLETLEDLELCKVILGSHCPNLHQFFLRHPKRGQLKIYHATNLHQLLGSNLSDIPLVQAFYNIFDCDFEDRILDSSEEPPRWYYDEDFIDQFNKRDYIVYSPWSSGARDWQQKTMDYILPILLQAGEVVINLGSSYQHQLPTHAPNFYQYTSLDIPTALQLIRNSKAFVGNSSALIQEAWYNKIPSFCIYHETDRHNFEDCLIKPGSDSYGWGSLLEGNVTMSEKEFIQNPRKLFDFFTN